MNRLLCALLLAATTAVAGPPHRTDVIVVGGLFSLSGDGATLGKASEAALALAARDINAEMAALQLPYLRTSDVAPFDIVMRHFSEIRYGGG